MNPLQMCPTLLIISGSMWFSLQGRQHHVFIIRGADDFESFKSILHPVFLSSKSLSVAVLFRFTVGKGANNYEITMQKVGNKYKETFL